METNEKHYSDEYVFNDKNSIIRRRNDEPDFKINDELKKIVYKGMPQGISLEEQAIFIYYRLCKIMNYDNNYIYDRSVSKKQEYTSEFSKERMESITADSKIVCWDFARLYAKFVNELGPGIEAVTISKDEGLDAHWKTGFYTDRISLTLEPINITNRKERGGPQDRLNDLTRIKNGIWPGEMHPNTGISGENMEWLVEIMDTMYTEAVGEIALDWQDKVALYKHASKHERQTEPEPNFDNKLVAFIEMLKERNIRGNEAILTAFEFNKALGYFSEEVVETILWKEGERNERMLALQRTGKKDENQVYLLNVDSDELSTSKISLDKMMLAIENGEYRYESEDHLLEI